VRLSRQRASIVEGITAGPTCGPPRRCPFARARYSKCFRRYGAAYGYDAVTKNMFLGFRIHLRCLRGAPTAAWPRAVPALRVLTRIIRATYSATGLRVV
jgi:hypothetical protein